MSCSPRRCVRVGRCRRTSEGRSALDAFGLEVPPLSQPRCRAGWGDHVGPGGVDPLFGQVHIGRVDVEADIVPAAAHTSHRCGPEPMNGSRTTSSR